VKIQNEPGRRGSVNDILDVTVSSSAGDEIPLSSVAEVVYRAGAREVASFNKMMSAYVEAVPADGVETSEVMDLIRAMPLPDGYVVEWGPIQMQEAENEGKLKWLILAAFMFAYLFLVAQYESWVLPVGVMLSVAVALAGAFFGLWVTDTSLSIYAQLGCVMLIGLAAKNAILMMEFARRAQESGASPVEAAMSGADLRYRAVMMTAWSFIIGVLPLVFATGAGAQSMKSIGICTCFGMMAATIFGIVLVPGLYVLFRPRTVLTQDTKENQYE
jgi:multidrug efflux pump subunit AcrB